MTYCQFLIGFILYDCAGMIGYRDVLHGVNFNTMLQYDVNILLANGITMKFVYFSVLYLFLNCAFTSSSIFLNFASCPSSFLSSSFIFPITKENISR